jgi:predicted nucleic acid-binding protein
MADPSLISYLDTRVVVYLHNGDVSRVSSKAQNQIENTDLPISVMVLLELEMLYDRSAITIKWTREPGDLLIVANAMASNGAPLVTKNEHIRNSYDNAIW